PYFWNKINLLALTSIDEQNKKWEDDGSRFITNIKSKINLKKIKEYLPYPEFPFSGRFQVDFDIIIRFSNPKNPKFHESYDFPELTSRMLCKKSYIELTESEQKLVSNTYLDLLVICYLNKSYFWDGGMSLLYRPYIDQYYKSGES